MYGSGSSPEKEKKVVELEEGSQNNERSTSAAPGQKMAGREVWSYGG